jgi:hypothetical protein
MPAKPRGLFLRQPRPIGAASANCDPDGISVNVFFNSKRAGV